MKTGFTALKVSLPALLCYFPLGVVYGVLCSQQGYPWYYTTLLSTFVLAGAMQFLALTFLAAGGPLFILALSLIPLGIRNIFYGITMRERFENAPPWLRAYLAHGLVDATYSLLVTGPRFEGEKDLRYVTWLTIFIHLSWVLGTLLGTAVDYIMILPPGLEFCLTAFFAAAAVEQLLKKREIAPLFLTLAALGAALLIAPGHFFLLGIGFVALGSLVFPSKKRKTA